MLQNMGGARRCGRVHANTYLCGRSEEKEVPVVVAMGTGEATVVTNLTHHTSVVHVTILHLVHKDSDENATYITPQMPIA